MLKCLKASVRSLLGSAMKACRTPSRADMSVHDNAVRDDRRGLCNADNHRQNQNGASGSQKCGVAAHENLKLGRACAVT